MTALVPLEAKSTKALCAAALAGGFASWIFFVTRPPERVRVGLELTSASVPVLYQVSVFPAFAMAVTLAILDTQARRPDARWNLVLIPALGAIALFRLAGWLTVSGHAVCLWALVVQAVLEYRRPERVWIGLVSVAGLSVVAWYKLAVWDDSGGFWLSLATGAFLAGLGHLGARFGNRKLAI